MEFMLINNKSPHLKHSQKSELQTLSKATPKQRHAVVDWPPATFLYVVSFFIFLPGKDSIELQNSSTRESSLRQTARNYTTHKDKNKATNCTTADMLHTQLVV